MTFRQFITIMLIATGSLWLGWWWTVISIDPYGTNWLGMTLFYLTLFLSLVGTLTLAGVFFRRRRMADAVLYQLVIISSRQSLLLALFFTALLFLQSQRMLHLWNGFLLIVVLFITEFLYVYKDHKRKPIQEIRVTEIPFQDDTVPPIFEKREI